MSATVFLDAFLTTGGALALCAANLVFGMLCTGLFCGFLVRRRAMRIADAELEQRLVEQFPFERPAHERGMTRRFVPRYRTARQAAGLHRPQSLWRIKREKKKQSKSDDDDNNHDTASEGSGDSDRGNGVNLSRRGSNRSSGSGANKSLRRSSASKRSRRAEMHTCLGCGRRFPQSLYEAHKKTCEDDPMTNAPKPGVFDESESSGDGEVPLQRTRTVRIAEEPVHLTRGSETNLSERVQYRPLSLGADDVDDLDDFDDADDANNVDDVKINKTDDSDETSSEKQEQDDTTSDSSSTATEGTLSSASLSPPQNVGQYGPIEDVVDTKELLEIQAAAGAVGGTTGTIEVYKPMEATIEPLELSSGSNSD